MVGHLNFNSEDWGDETVEKDDMKSFLGSGSPVSSGRWAAGSAPDS
jgi:hypothetical protein